MTLDEILIDVQAKAIENVDLKNEELAKQQAITDILNKNYKTIVKPELRKIMDIIWLVSDKVSRSFYVNNGRFIRIKHIENYSHSDNFFYIYGYKNDGSKDSLRIDEISKSCINCWTEHFMTEERSFAYLKDIKEELAEYLCTFANEISAQNDTLKESIKKLAEQLETGSAVETKEDGSIVINLNGKTYIGTVKEE